MAIYFDHAIGQLVLVANRVENATEARHLFVTPHVLKNDDEPGMKLDSSQKREKVRTVVGDQNEILIEQMRPQLDIRESTPTMMGNMICLVACPVSDIDERGREAFIDEELHLPRRRPALGRSRQGALAGRPRRGLVSAYASAA